MNQVVHYTSCPVCESVKIDPLLKVKDFTVSKEDFVIWQCSHCSLRFTQDAPDAANISKYYKSEDYISHSGTTKGLVNKWYIRVRKFTLAQKANLVIKVTGLQKGSLLDVGTGTGAFLQVLKEKGWQVTGLEPDMEAGERALQWHGVEVMEADRLFSLPPASFDAITMWHVLEHVHELHRYIGQLKSLLKDKGILLVAVPNYTSLEAGHYGPFWAAYDVPRHLYHFTPKSMETLVRAHGLEIIDKKPMWFDSFYISMLSSKYHSGSTKLFSSFFNGLRSNIKAVIDKDRCSSIIYVIGKS